jgi:2-polyprenyl-6-methoxyphenol hydroxylase-like FAD-dependent oxidoreductase
MMLARDGHAVTLLEADPDDAPSGAAEAWTTWRRRGVAQFRQPHALFARIRQVFEQELPGIVERLVAAGCVRNNRLDAAPPGIRERRPGDERFDAVTGRRPVVEAVLAVAAADEPGLTVRRGVRVAGLLGGPSAVRGVPHVAGVVTDGGEHLPADLVVDATGRRSPADRWLADLGAVAPVEKAQDAGFVYYTRYFSGPAVPELRGPALCPLGSITALTLEGDNASWSVTLFGTTSDTPLKRLRRTEVFDRVVRACPLQAHWLDGTPTTEVVAMAGAIDRYRRFVVDGRPVATGLAAVGDAWACTNPSAGRGITVGLLHAQLLRATVRTHLDDPAGFAAAWHEGTGRVVAPYVHAQLAADQARLAEMSALRHGVDPPAPELLAAGFATAAATDPDAFRGMLDLVMCLARPDEVFARPAVRAAVAAAGAPVPLPGPDRARLLALLAA